MLLSWEELQWLECECTQRFVAFHASPSFIGWLEDVLDESRVVHTLGKNNKIETSSESLLIDFCSRQQDEICCGVECTPFRANLEITAE